jgi:hypothetical protein
MCGSLGGKCLQGISVHEKAKMRRKSEKELEET